MLHLFFLMLLLCLFFPVSMLLLFSFQPRRSSNDSSAGPPCTGRMIRPSSISLLTSNGTNLRCKGSCLLLLPCATSKALALNLFVFVCLDNLGPYRNRMECRAIFFASTSSKCFNHGSSNRRLWPELMREFPASMDWLDGGI